MSGRKSTEKVYEFAREPSNNTLGSDKRRCALIALIGVIIVVLVLAMLCYITYENVNTRADINREMTLQKTEFAYMRSGMNMMETKFNQIIRQWDEMHDVTRNLTRLQGNLETLKTDLEEMLQLEDDFDEMSDLIANMSGMTDKLNGMMKLNSALMKTADEVSAIRHQFNRTNAKLGAIPVINAKLGSLSEDTEKLGGIKNTMDDMKRDYEAMQRDIEGLRWEIVTRRTRKGRKSTEEVEFAREPYNDMPESYSNRRCGLSVFKGVLVFAGLAMLCYITYEHVYEHAYTRADINREMTLQKIELSDMRSGMNMMDTKFNQFILQWDEMHDVTRNLTRVQGNLETLKTDLEDILQLEDEFDEMSDLIANMSDMTDKLNGMMKLNSALMKTAEEVSALRNQFNHTNAKLGEIPVINAKLDSLSEDTAKLGGIKNTMDDMERDYKAMQRGIEGLRNDIVTWRNTKDSTNGSSTPKNGFPAIRLILPCVVIARIYV